MNALTPHIHKINPCLHQSNAYQHTNHQFTTQKQVSDKESWESQKVYDPVNSYNPANPDSDNQFLNPISLPHIHQINPTCHQSRANQ